MGYIFNCTKNYIKCASGILLLILMLSACTNEQTVPDVDFENKDSIRLLIRGDDMGINHATNQAIIDSYTDGIQKSAEVIVPGPWFLEAAALLQEHPGLDAGVHLTLSSEWSYLKWSPLTNSKSLVDDNGYFYPMIWSNEHYGADQALREQNWKISEIEQEFRKQIEKARKHIPQISHLSYHMGCNDMDPSVHDLVENLAQEYGLDINLNKAGVQRLHLQGPHDSVKSLTNRFLEKVSKLEPGDYYYIGHPAYDTSEMQAVFLKGNTDVARNRQMITELYTSSEVQNSLEKWNVKLIDYTDLIEN